MARTKPTPSNGSQSPQPRGLYTGLFSAAELTALAAAAEAGSLAGEIELLRVLIRRATAAAGAVPEVDQLDSISRAIQVLTTSVRAQHVITGAAAANLQEALARALDEVANELGLGGTS